MVILDEDVVPSFKLHKKIFQDLTNKDIKNNVTSPLLLPPLVQQFLNQSQPNPVANPVAPQVVNFAGPSVARKSRPKRRKLIANYSYADLAPEAPVEVDTVEVVSEPKWRKTGQDATGTGMGEGSGVKDVSDQIDDEDQLIGIEKPSEEKGREKVSHLYS